MLLPQDKGRGIAIMDRNRYKNKCMNILNIELFPKLDRDPTKSIEAKIHKAI